MMLDSAFPLWNEDQMLDLIDLRAFASIADLRSVSGAARALRMHGTVGRMLKAQGRHPYRPAHIHFMLSAPGHHRLITHLFLEHSGYLDSDVVFGVKDSLVRNVERRPAGPTEAGGVMPLPYWTIQANLRLSDADMPLS